VYSLGIDIGGSSFKFSLINLDTGITRHLYVLHKGKIAETLRKSIEDLLLEYNPQDIKLGAVTGSASRFLSSNKKISFINEVSAIVEGGLKTDINIGSIIEIGGQSSKYITGLSGEDKSRIEISMNSNCSAGTGSFLEEQANRLNLRLEDYALYASRGRSIPRIAGRCSVFAKTDITHHQQEGVPVEDILLGLAQAMVKNYRGTVMKKLPRKKPILFAGGVAHNQAIIDALREVLNLEEGDLIVPDHFASIGALGAAVIAGQKRIPLDLEQLLEVSAQGDDFLPEEDSRIQLPTLASFGTQDSLAKHDCPPLNPGSLDLDCYLGIDVGSTSVNLVLTDRRDRVVCFKYLRTRGRPVEVVQEGLHQLEMELGGRVNVLGAGVTGSGRHMIGKLVGADVIKDEITSQARAAVSLDRSVDTIFEIGGQDSKYISLEDGVVIDFQMNKICAAGTGSFIEEQANKFNIDINDFGPIATNSNDPIYLGERCTVFMETSIAAHLTRGAKLEDIASGLCYSIVKNYLNRVVGQKKIGNKIFLQGGVAHNQGVVNAFKALLGKDIHVPPFFSVTGAYGAAILAREEMGSSKTGFKGFDIEPGEGFIGIKKRDEFKTDNNELFNRQMEELIFKDYDGLLDSKKKTVGIPRALFTYGMFPMFYTFFKELGFNVLLSDRTSEETIRLGQEYSLGEACYPLKLINGHVAELVGKKVDYIFFPDLYTVDHPGSQARKNYGCPYMQLAFKVINQAMALEDRGITLLAPTIAFNLGKEFMIRSFSNLGRQLSRGPEETAEALGKGMKAFYDFEERIRKHGIELVKQIEPDEKAFVIVSKIYGVADPVLNMGIPAKLMDLGYKVLGFYDLPEGDTSQEHPNMYWPFGQHILEPAQVIKRHPNLYAILLTHHGCGPDSVLAHYFREMMEGKPYLNIEVDEHSSDVGVLTRIEAFVNSLAREKAEEAKEPGFYARTIAHRKVNIKTHLSDLNAGSRLYLPHMHPYSQIFERMLMKKGIKARVLPRTDYASLELGRRHTVTNEYLSLTALLGDVLKVLGDGGGQGNGLAFLIPQTEGAEIDGQANRFLRTKLDEQGYGSVDVLAPFIEDALGRSQEDATNICLGLLAGDIIRSAQPKQREEHLQRVLDIVGRQGLRIDGLVKMAEEIRRESSNMRGGKRVFAVGEALILFNDFLNGFIFKNIEDSGHRVIYAPFSEYMWLMWRDFFDQNGRPPLLRARLEEFAGQIVGLSQCLAAESPFEENLETLVEIADQTMGYYSGAFGRYREAKVLSHLRAIDGIVTVASTYENTAISLGILHKGFEKPDSKPVLNLTFDGNKNENDRMKIDSYLYYL